MSEYHVDVFGVIRLYMLFVCIYVYIIHKFRCCFATHVGGINKQVSQTDAAVGSRV